MQLKLILLLIIFFFPRLAFPQATVEQLRLAGEWLSQEQNKDGSWGSTEYEKFALTPSIVKALDISSQRGTAYNAGVTWLENHFIGNQDYAARRIIALRSQETNVEQVITDLEVGSGTIFDFFHVGRTIIEGQESWGLTPSYSSSAMDTGLVLSAFKERQLISDTEAAVSYLAGSRKSGNHNTGWGFSFSSKADPVSTSLALIGLREAGIEADSSLSLYGLDYLSAIVDEASPVYISSLAALAAMSYSNNSLSFSWIESISSRQLLNGSWGNELYDTALAIESIAVSLGMDNDGGRTFVDVVDENLRAAINRALGRNEMDSITRFDISQLTHLDASGVNIENIQGLEWAVNLVSLNLNDNNISDISSLVELNNLQDVGFIGNPLDQDGDGLMDDVEVSYGFNPLLVDSDSDGLSDMEEVCYDGNCFIYSPYPIGGDSNALLEDTDRDGLGDGEEVAKGRSPILNEPAVWLLIMNSAIL